MGKSKLIISCALIFFIGCGLRYRSVKMNPTPVSPQAMADYYYLKYLDLARGKKYNEALKALDKAIHYSPDPELFLEYAKVLLTQKKLNKAKEALKLGLQKNPGNQELVFFLADIYVFEKKFFNAYSILKVFLKEHKDNIQAREKIASILFEQKKFQDALDYLLEIPENKRTFKVNYFIGTCYLKMGNRSKGIYFLKKATEQNPDFFRGWAELAYQYELSNDLVSAEKIYSKLLSKGFANKDLIFRLIDINIKLNKPQKAYSIAQDMLSDPKDVLDVVGLFLREGFYDQGEALLKTIENFRDEYPRIPYYLAIIKLKKYKDLKGAIGELQEISSDTRIYPNVLDLKIKLLIRTKDYKGAEKILKEQLQKHPNNLAIYMLLSDVYMLDGRLEDAKDLLNKAIEKNPNNIDLLFQLGTVYYKLNDIQRAISLMEKILQIKPNHASALNFIGYTLVDKNIDIKRGYKLIKKALTIQPKNGYFLDSMAWYYYKIKDYKHAWEYINKAVKKVSDDPTIWEHFGDIAFNLKKFKQAKKGYKNALSNGAEDSDKIREKLKKIK